MTNIQRYWWLSSWGSVHRRRMSIELDILPEERFRLFNGLGLTHRTDPILARVTNGMEPEDMPKCSEPVVSQKVQSILESHEVPLISFLPISLTPNSQAIQVKQYKVLICVLVLECHSTSDRFDESRTYLRDFTLDVSRVPCNIDLFVPKFAGGLIVSNRIRRAFESAGVTGCRFLEPIPLKPFW
jgi:hypothetical protein